MRSQQRLPSGLHGTDRFLVLARDVVAESNLVSSDIVLVRAGQTADTLFDVTNPGLWMSHCHIAEHVRAGAGQTALRLEAMVRRVRDAGAR
jgi:FtsP/CotA-like multicopper oxidase with cupredoxin domain